VLNYFSTLFRDQILSAPSDSLPLQDVSIIGGSIAGLIAGRELALEGIDVSIYEEHREIGVPEKCDGLVSSAGIARLGIVPPQSVVQNALTKAVFFSPSMKEISIRAEKQNVIVLDRSRFDKHLAELAARAGAKIYVGRRVSQYSDDGSKTSLHIDSEIFNSKFLLDCGGYESYISAGGKALQGGQYLVYGNWFEKNTVEVYIDPDTYPGFFKWVIPLSSDTAKIGVAGEGINTFGILDQFVRERKATVFRKMAAPVLCFGTIKSFVNGRIIRAGDAAGQAKPTTGGGIYTGGFGGMLAGKALTRSIKEKDPELVGDYENAWKDEFGREFNLQSRARSAFSKLSRDQVDKLFEMVGSSDIPKIISDEGDFDRHSIALVKAFGLSNVVSTFGMFFTNELKDLLKI
jgi:digeranylgeranylglycerophospholipid reductase